MINKILPLLSNVKQTKPNVWMASCPLHADKHPSFVITEADDKLLMKCFSCHGAVEDIVAAIGLTVSDLFPDSPNVGYTRQRRQYFPAKEVLRALTYDINFISICAHDVRQGKQLNDKTLKQLHISQRRLEVANEYTG